MLIRRGVLVGAALVLLVAACVHRSSIVWQNPTNPAADSARDLYDCDLTAKEVIAAQYPGNSVAQGLYHRKELERCMESRGWRKMDANLLPNRSAATGDSIHFNPPVCYNQGVVVSCPPARTQRQIRHDEKVRRDSIAEADSIRGVMQHDSATSQIRPEPLLGGR